MEDFLRLSATSLVDKITSKTLSSVEVVQAHIERIKSINPQINAVQQLHAESALRQAQLADMALAKGKSLGKLHGLPISFKDTSYVKGFKISRGSKLLYGKIATHYCTVAARLKAAGAIILALTNVPELLMRFQTDNILYGRTNNPYDLLRTPGGSSGGEAALIAACGSPLGIGSDFAGSIRQPAHNCGIVGIKPTQMLVPNTGAFPIDNAGLILNCTTLGPMARYIEDLCLTLPLIAGPDGYDPHIPPIKLGDITQVKLSDLQATYFFSDGYNRIDDDTANTMQMVINALQTEVKSIKEHQDKCLKEISQVHFETTLLSDDRAKGLSLLFKELSDEDISPFMQDTIRLLKTKKVTTTELRNRLIAAQHFPFKFMRAYHSTDIILCPIGISPANKHSLSNDALTDYTFLPLFNITGWPAVTVRCGTSQQGLPIGIQIAAKPWHDHIALAVAKRLEALFGGWQMPAL